MSLIGNNAIWTNRNNLQWKNGLKIPQGTILHFIRMEGNHFGWLSYAFFVMIHCISEIFFFPSCGNKCTINTCQCSFPGRNPIFFLTSYFHIISHPSILWQDFNLSQLHVTICLQHPAISWSFSFSLLLLEGGRNMRGSQGAEAETTRSHCPKPSNHCDVTKGSVTPAASERSS